MKTARLVRAAVVLPALALLGLAGWQALYSGWADIVSLRARAELKIWATSGKAAPRERWQRDVDELRDGLRLKPGAASLQDEMGQAYALAAERSPSPSVAGFYSEFALAHFRSATLLRPTWPYSWYAIALTLGQLGRVDAEFFGALARALRYGPWEPGVQRGTSGLGLAFWERLDPALREAVRQGWRRTAVRQADELARIAVIQRREKILCDQHLPGMDARLKCGKH